MFDSVEMGLAGFCEHVYQLKSAYTHSCIYPFFFFFLVFIDKSSLSMAHEKVWQSALSLEIFSIETASLSLPWWLVILDLELFVLLIFSISIEL